MLTAQLRRTPSQIKQDPDHRWLLGLFVKHLSQDGQSLLDGYPAIYAERHSTAGDADGYG